MPRIPQKAQTEGSTTFDPNKFFEAWAKEKLTPPYDNNFRRFIIRSFGLPLSDTYGYQATTEVTLLQAQTHIEFGAQGGLHAWYKDEDGQEVSMSRSSNSRLNLIPKHSPKRRVREMNYLQRPTFQRIPTCSGL